MQEGLRREIVAAEMQEPTYDQLVNGFPYLDAVTCEVLRMRPPVSAILKEVRFSFFMDPSSTYILIIILKAQEDDVVPLSHPIRAASGELVDSIFVARGTVVRIPVAGVNRSEALWGEDANKFDTTRWLSSSSGDVTVEDGVLKDPIVGRAAEIHGYRHLLTFSNGPRTCLGRNFALVEFKVSDSPSIFSCLIFFHLFQYPSHLWI